MPCLKGPCTCTYSQKLLQRWFDLSPHCRWLILHRHPNKRFVSLATWILELVVLNFYMLHRWHFHHAAPTHSVPVLWDESWFYLSTRAIRSSVLLSHLTINPSSTLFQLMNVLFAFVFCDVTAIYPLSVVVICNFRLRGGSLWGSAFRFSGKQEMQPAWCGYWVNTFKTWARESCATCFCWCCAERFV